MSRPVLVALRIALIVVSIYLVASAAALLLEGRWLVKVGARAVEAEPSTLGLLESNLELVIRLEHLETSVDRIWELLNEIEGELEDEIEEELE